MADNEGIVRACYEAFGKADVPFILSKLDPSVKWVSNCPPGSIPWGGTRHGHTGAVSFFEVLSERIDMELFEPQQMVSGKDLVFVRGRTVALVRSTRKKFDSDWVHVFTFSDGKITRFQEFYDTAAIVLSLAP
jgi:ketosteroid isomerase-like protein